VDLEGRLALLRRVLDDPPSVHDHPTGVLSADEGTYRFLAHACEPGSRTLETGLGVSTVLFAAWGAEHTCVVESQDEIDRLIDYLDSHEISRARLTFAVGSSDRVLPNLTLRGLDIVLADGCHGWPLPIIDWYFAGSMLKQGGLFMLDDVQLKSVTVGLIAYLDADPRWDRLERTPRWTAYRRLSGGDLCEDWTAQPFLGIPLHYRYARLVPAGLRPVAKRVAKRLGLL
jgi:hypothetical protein